MIQEILLVAWFFVVGAAIGSFLNVVIYRLPRGMSLIMPPSHCPACKHRIRWFDNIPVISWLALRGRCRDCRSSISIRYPAVEAVTACMFALLSTVEFVFRGINLPLREIHDGINSSLSGWDDSQLYGILLYHSLLLCTLLAAALIEIDGQRPTVRLFVPALAVGLVAPVVWPHLRPVAAWPELADWTGRAMDCAAGLAAGGFLGYMAWRLRGAKSAAGLAWGLACVGIFLGWQAVFGVGFVMLLLRLPAAALEKGRKMDRPLPSPPAPLPNRERGVILGWPFTALLYTVTFGWILAWSPIVDLAKRFMG